jgi:hypothetical protein
MRASVIAPARSSACPCSLNVRETISTSVPAMRAIRAASTSSAAIPCLMSSSTAV